MLVLQPKNIKFQIPNRKVKYMYYSKQTLINQRKRFRRFIFLLIIISLFGRIKLEL
jgi:hypothetical protein